MPQCHAGQQTALALLARLHDLPVQDAAERARLYREELLAAKAWRQLKSAMDLRCRLLVLAGRVAGRGTAAQHTRTAVAGNSGGSRPHRSPD
ncbi:MAG UNVERIFIED_CONTAM: hypothetical protein LVR18_15010 [Planctomycetaceae bacterium]